MGFFSSVREWLQFNWLREVSTRFRGQRKRPTIRHHHYARPLVEQLEDRTLLSSVSVSVSGTNASFTSAIVSDNVYLQTVGTQVQWSPDGASWQNVNVTLAGPTGSNAFTFQMSGALYLENFVGAGGALSFEGVGASSGGFIGPSDVHIQGNLLTKGGSLTFNDVQGVDIANSVVVSTRQISASDLTQGHFATGASTGSSGAVNITVNNTDPLNPTLYINFTDPHIEIGAGAAILAGATNGFAPGDVTLDVTNINYSLQTQLFSLFSAMERNASITLDTGASITGANVTLDSDAGDLNPLDLLAGATGDQLTPQASNSLGTGSDRILALMNPFLLPLSVIYRNASASVTVGQSANIDASGAVDMESDATANAAASSLYIFNTRVQISLALSWAQTDAETVVDPSATIDAGSNVTIHSLANSLSVTSAQAASTAPAGTPSNSVQISGGVGINKVTSHATVGVGATITSAGNVNVEAEGVNNSDTKVAAKSNNNGTAGLTFGIGDSTTDILAEVDGTVTAAGASTGTLASLNPFSQIDWGATNSIITFSTPQTFSNGEEIAYSSGNDGAIPGLVNGSDYYIINVPGHANQIQLAASYEDATNGVPIVFGSFPYLTADIRGDEVNVPITQIDSTNDAIEYAYNPGFTAGQTVTYHVAPNQAIGSLVDGQTYTIQLAAGKTDEFQLLDASSNVVPVSTDAGFGAIPYITATINSVTVNLPITQVDDVNNALEFPDAIPGLSNLSVTYHAADGQAIANLINGHTYTVTQFGTTGGEYQLFDSSSNLIPIFTDPTFTGLAQNLPVTLNTANQTLAFNYNIGFSDESQIVYQGATDASSNPVNITGLTVGQLYWMLPVANDTTGTLYQLTTTLDGTPIAISASETALNFHFTPFVGVDADNDTVTVGFNIATDPNFAAHGQALTYQGALGSAYSGLIQGQTYYALVDPDPFDPQTLYLTNTAADAALAYNAGQTAYQTQLTAQQNQYIAAGQSASAALASANSDASTAGAVWSANGIYSATDAAPPPAGPYAVSVAANELLFSFAPGIALGTPIGYEGTTAGAITGLTPYTTYYAIPDPGNANAFALADTAQDAYLGNALTISGAGTINLGPPLPAPSSATLGANAFTFAAGSDQGWRTGDSIIFGGAADSSGTSVTINTTDPNNVSGTLQVGQTYYAVVDPNNPNVVQLANTLTQAQNDQPLTLSATTTALQINLLAPLPTGQSPFPTVQPPVVVDFGTLDTDVMSGDTHMIAPLQGSGVSIVATLTSKEKVVSQAQPGRSFSMYGVSFTAPALYSAVSSNNAAAGNNSPSSQTSNNPAGNQSAAQNVQGVPGGTGTPPKFSAAGSFVVIVSTNNVNAVVGSTAVIHSSADVNVAATMTDTVQDASMATLVVSPNDPTKVAAALAVTVSVISSTVKATVMDGAQIDATGAVNVNANLSYPFTFPTTAPSGLANILGFSLGAVLGLFLDNTLGLQTVLFNDWTQASSTTGPPTPSASGGTTPGGAQYGIGGAIDIHYWNDDVEATIGDALINQDSSFDRPGQTVNVEAETTWDNIGVAGVFDLKVGLGTLISNLKNGKPASTGTSASGIGSQSQKSGLGATIDITIMSNTTLAQIKSGAKLHIGPSGALNVNASQNILDISLNQSGASAKDIGFAGTVAWNNLVSSTIAQIQDGVDVNQQTGDAQGGPVTVNATDTVIMASLAGGVAKANHIGFGFTLSVDNLDRTTLALIGSNPLTNGGATPLAGSFNVASLDIEALTTGTIVSASYAAGISTPAPPPTSNPLGGAGLPTTPPGQTGVGAAGDVGIVVMKSTTDAAIDDTGAFTIGGDVTISAESNSIVVSIAGAIGVSQQTTGGNIGLAGSFGVNVITSVTDAFIYGAQITADLLNVSAVHMDSIGALTAGGAGASPISAGDSTAMAGSVSINLILPDTEAYISGATISLIGDSSVSADEKSDIWSIAGGVAFGGTGGYGVAVALNIIGSPTIGGVTADPVLVPNQPNDLPVEDGTTAAFISASTITIVGGTLSVTAINENPAVDPRIIVVAGAIGAGTGAGGTGDAGMLAVNIIQDDTDAYITGSSSVTEVAAPTGVTDPGPASISIHAKDVSGIDSFGGGIAVGSGEGVGAAFGWNEINDNITADIESTTVDITGSVTVNAQSQESILGVDLGVGIGKGAGIAGAGSLAVNIISDATDAHIKGSDITADTGVFVTSADTAAIETGTGQVAIALDGASVGASVSVDTINNITRAYIDSTTVTTTTGAATVTANSGLTITAVAAGGTGATTFTLGASEAVNTITDTTDAQVTGGANITSAGLTVSATDNSDIGTGAGEVSIATSGSAVGAAIALNSIDNKVKAYIDDSTVNSSGEVDVTASSAETILAIAIGVGGAASNGAFSASLVGSGAGNTVTDSTEALIEDNSSVTTTGGADVVITATDSITLTAGAGVFSLSLATKGGVGVAVGVSAATNSVGSSGTPDDVTAAIEDSTVDADGGVSVIATDSATILAVTVAGSGSISSGGGGGVGIDGAGAGSGNTIYVTTQALINLGSSVTTHHSDNVTLTATNSSSIEADGGGLSIAGSFGSSAGGAISVGAAVASNKITDNTFAIIAGSTVIAAGAVALAATSSQTIKAITLGIAGSLAGGSGGGIAFGGAGSGSGNTVNDETEALIEDGVNASSVSVHSYVTSGEPATGTTLNNETVCLTATESAYILAGAGALGVGIGAGTTGAGIAIGVSAASNSITDTVEANINSSMVSSGGGVTLTASTQPPVGESHSIFAVTVAGGVAVGVGEDAGLAFALAGAGSSNTIDNTVTASITNSTGAGANGTQLGVSTQNGGAVSLSATDNSDILADGGGTSVAVGVPTDPISLGASIAIGAGYATNSITNVTKAFIDDSTVASAGKVTITATSNATIASTAFGVALSVAGGLVAGSAAGSGAASYNTIDDTVYAYIQNASTVTAASTAADAVKVSATDNSTTTSKGGAGSLAVSGGGASGSLAVGAVIANNTVGNDIEAFISTASGSNDSTNVTSSGGVQILATSTTTVQALGVAVAAAISTGAGVALTGSGASSTNTITNTITAAIRNHSTVHATGTSAFDKVQVSAQDSNSTITARVGAGAGAVGYYAASIGVSLVDNDVTNTVSAYIDHATVTTKGQELDVTAGSTVTISGLSVATAVAIGLGAAGAGGNTTSTNNTVTSAYIGTGSTIDTQGYGTDLATNFGDLDVSAASTGGSIHAETDGGAGALGSIGTFLASATLGGSTIAHLSEGSTINVGNLTVSAVSGQTVTTRTVAVVIGVIAGSGTQSTTTIGNNVEAYIGTPSNTTATTVNASGAVSVTALANANGTAEADGGLGALAGVSGNVAHNTIDPTVKAFVSDNFTVNAGGNMTVSATANNTASSTTTGVSVTLYGIGVSDAEATVSAHVAAYVGKVTLTVGGNLTISATSTDVATSSADASGGAYLVGANGATADATINPDVLAYTGDAGGAANITVTGTASVVAQESAHADATGNSITVTLGLAVGVVTSDAEVTNASGKSVSAYLGAGTTLTAGNLEVDAGQIQDSSGDPTAQATSTAAAGSLVGVIATSSTANTSTAVDAHIGNNSTIVVTGADSIINGQATPALDVQATNTTNQNAYVSGKQGSLFLAVGVNSDTASSTTATTGYVGNNVNITATAGTLHIGATGSDTNRADAVSGAGAIVSGASTTANTSTTAATNAYIGTAGATKMINVNALQLAADHTANFNSTVDSVNASIIGGSAADANNTVTSTVNANIGAGVNILTYSLDVTATNNEIKRLFGAGYDLTTDPTGQYDGVNVNSASGAALGDFPGASSSSTIANTTAVNVGDGATINVIGNYFDPGDFVLLALNDIQAVDKVEINNGAFVAASFAGSSITADTDSATVNIGSNTPNAPTVTLNSIGDIDAEAVSQANIQTSADAKTYGFAGGAAGTATSEVKNDDTIHLFGNAYLHALNNINLLAGREEDAVQNSLIAQANTNLFIGVGFGGTTPNAYANIYQQNYVQVDSGAQVLSVGDANLYAVQGYHRADGEGYGEVRVAGVPLELDGGESTDDPIDGVTVNGTVKVGIQHIQDLTINEKVGGTATSNGVNPDGTTFTPQVGGASVTDYGSLTGIIAFTVASINASKDLTVNVPAGYAFIEGQTLTFFTTSPGVSGTLMNGSSYTVHVISNGASQSVIQLKDGSNTVIGADPTTASSDSLQAFGGSFPISSFNASTNTLTVPVTPIYPLVEGQTVTYLSPANTSTNYTVHIVSGPDAGGNMQIQLKDSNGNVVAVSSNVYTLPSINIDEQSQGISSPTVTAENLGLDLFNQVTNLLSLVATHAGDANAVAGYKAQIASLNLELISLGLISPSDPAYSDPADYAPAIPDSYTVFYINVPDIVARLGTINVVADYFVGTGDLESPGDAEINMVNNSPLFLNIGNLTIPTGEGGEITFNGFAVTSNTTINADNKIPSYASPANTTANFNPFITAANSPAPEITVHSTYNPAFDAVNTFPAGYTPTAPDIYVTGTLSNTSVNGSLTLTNDKGSIIVNPAVGSNGISTGGALQAATINISAGRNFILTTAGFQSIGGDPADQWLGVVQANENPGGTPLLNSGTVSSPITSQQAGLLPTTNPPAVGSIIAQDDVLISAQYLNINGTVQSGVQDHNLALSSSLNTTIQADQTDYNNKENNGAGSTANPLYLLQTASTDNITAYYNAKDQNIEIDATQVQGGYMQLTGHILSTGNGNIKVIDGYGRINVTNTTAYDIVLNNLDTGGAGIAGKLVIVDTALNPTHTTSSGTTTDTSTPLTTTYVLLGDTVTSTTNSTDINGNPLSQTYASGTRTASYTPLAGQVYEWEDGNAATHTTTYHHSYDSFWGMPVIGTSNYDTTGWDTSNQIDSAAQPLPGGPWLGTATTPYAGYTFQAWNVVNSTDVVVDTSTDRHSHGCPPVFGYYSYDAYVTKSHGETEYYLNTVKADYSIPITFIGYDSGSITVNSQASNGAAGNILIAGNITNTGGSVTLTSGHGSINTIADVTIKADAITLSAATGIGNTGVINTNLLNGGALSAITTTGDIHVNEVTGVLKYSALKSTGSDANLTGQGNVTVTSDGNITAASSAALIWGNLITLTSNNGSIGSSSQPVVIQSADTTTGGLTASASQDVYVEEQSGDLDLFSVSSFSGNVWLDALAGNIIDHNPVRPIDSATQSELDSLYASLNLLGANPNAATATDDANNAAAQVAAYLSGKTSDYQTYWQFRHVQQQANGTFTADAYSASPQFVLSAQEVSVYETQLGWTAAQVTAYEATETTQFQALQTELQSWKGQGGVDPTNIANYTASFNYSTFITPAELTAEEAGVASGATWTLDQLKFPMDGGLLGFTSFTIVLPQTPNVIANAGNVTLLASGGIGVTNGQSVIDLTSLSNWASLSTTQKAALAVAEPSDVTNNNGILTIDQRLAIDVEASKGHIDATAGDNIFIASQNNDLVLDQVKSGINSASSVAADIRIKSAEGIFQAPTSAAYNVGSPKDINLILEAAGTSIGTSTAPILISATANSPLTAQAQQNVYVQQINGDLLLQQVTAITGVAQLTANGSIAVDTTTSSHIDVFAQSLDLEVTGNVGSSTTRLLIQLGATGDLTGNVTGNTFIESTSALNVGKFVSTGGDVDLLIDTGDANLGQIIADAGTVKVFTELGDITNINTGATTDISAEGVSLSAVQGDIGSAVDAVTIDTSSSTTGVVFAFAYGGVYLDDVNGDLRIDQITGEHGDVTLIADGSIVDGDDDTRTKIFGVNITLTATTGGIGSATHDLNVDSSDPTPGVLNATANDGIYITQTAEALNVGQLQSTLGDVRLTVPEVADLAENMVLTAASFIKAGANILLQVGSNFDMATGSLIQAVGSVEVSGDFDNGAVFTPDPGTTFNLFGQIYGTPIYIHGDDDGDTFNIAVVVANEPMKVEGLGANDTFNVSSAAPTNQGNLTGIQARLSIFADAGTKNRLLVSDFGGTTSKTVTVTNSAITGFAGGEIDYAGQSGATFNDTGVNDGILLQGSGTASTIFNIQSTLAGSTITVKGGAANDSFNIGSAANSLAGILGLLTLDGAANASTPVTTLTSGSDSASLPTGDSVQFNDQGDATTGLTYDLYATTFTTSLLTNAITFLNTESVILNTAIPATTTNIHTTGASTNTFVNGNVNADVVNVLNTGASASLSVNAGNGNNSMFVQKTGAASFTQLAGGTGNDIYDIASNAAVGVTPGTGSLDNIHGVLGIDAGTGTGNRLFLDNERGSVTSNVVFTNGKITGLAINATIDYSASGNGGFNDLGTPTVYDGILVYGASAGADTFNIQSTLAGSTTQIVGSPFNDVFNLGSATNSLGGLLGNLTVNGLGNASTPTNSVSAQNLADTLTASKSLPVGDTVNFDDQGDNTAGGFTYTLTKSTLNRSGLPETQPAITYQGMETVNLNAALQASVVNVTNTADSVDTTINGSVNPTATGDTITVATTGVNSLVNLNAGTGDSTINLQATGATSFTRILGHGGNDTINVSSTAGTTTPGNTDAVLGTLYIDAGAGSANRLFFDDSTGAINTDVVFNSDTIVGLAPATVFYKATGGNYPDPASTYADGILIHGSSSGGNTFNIQSTLAGSTTEIDGDGASDNFNVSSDAPTNHGNLAGILGNLTVLGGTGAANRLIVSDYGNTTLAKTNVIQTTVSVDSTPFQQIQNFAGAANGPAISYNALGSFNDIVSQVDQADGILLIGSHTLGTTFTFRSTLLGSTITADGGIANDNFNVGSPLTDLPGNKGDSGDLDLIQGLLTVVGNGGADALEADDTGALGAFNYIVTPTSIANDPSTQPTVPAPTIAPARTFAGILYDSTGVAASDTVTTLRLDGTDQVNIFNVSPSKITTYTINGNLPAPGVPMVGGGDYLQLNTTQLAGGTGGRLLHIASIGAGYWSFTDGSKSVNFLSIERFNHVAVVASVAYSGQVSLITVRDAETGTIKYQIKENSPGPYSMAVADVNFDGLPDLIVAPGTGQVSTLQIFSGAPNINGAYTGASLGTIPVYSPNFKGGVNIAAGDVNGDGAVDLIVGPASGMLNPQIMVFNGLDLLTTHAQLGPVFSAFESGFYGGVTLGAGDLGLNGYADIVAGRSTSGLPTVNVFDGKTYGLLKTFNAFSTNFKGGESVAVGDYNGDGVPDIIVGAGPGNFLPIIEVFNGATLFTQATPTIFATLLAGPTTYQGGLTVQVAPVNGGDPGFVERDFIGGTLHNGAASYFTLLPTDSAWWAPTLAGKFPGVVSATVFDLKGNADLLQDNGVLDQWQNGKTLVAVSSNVASFKVGANGSIYFLQATGNLYRWQSGALALITTAVTSYGVDAAGKVYVLQNNHNLSLWQGGPLALISASVTSFDVTAAGAVYFLQSTGLAFAAATNGNLKQWKAGVTTMLAGTVMSFKLGVNGVVTYLQTTGNLLQWNGSATSLTSNVTSFAVAADGTVYVVQTGGALVSYLNGVPTSLLSAVTSISLAPNGTLYVLRAGNVMQYQNGSWATLLTGITSFAVVGNGAAIYGLQTNAKLVEWQNNNKTTVTTNVTSFTAAPNGAIFALQSTGVLQLWRAKTLATTLTAVKSFFVASDGIAYALQTNGNLMQWQGTAWTLLASAVSAFLVAPDCTLYVLKTTGSLYKYQGAAATLLASLVSSIAFVNQGTVLNATLTNSSVSQFNT